MLIKAISTDRVQRNANLTLLVHVKQGLVHSVFYYKQLDFIFQLGITAQANIPSPSCQNRPLAKGKTDNAVDNTTFCRARRKLGRLEEVIYPEWETVTTGAGGDK